MKKEEVERIKRKQDIRFALTLKFMDQSPIIQKVTKMKPYELEALSETERGEIQALVLNAINVATEKAEMIVKEKTGDST